MKDEFLAMLQSTEREGMDAVVEYLKKSHFFQDPASVNRHLCNEGGLMEHSMNVCRMALKLRNLAIEMKPDLEPRLPKDSVIICALLHDLCKCNIYKEATRNRKNKDGRWESYATWDVDYSRFPLGHGEKSVIMLLHMGLKLTKDEIIAIRWHMGAWNLAFQSYEEKSNISAAAETCPLLAIIQAADGMSAHLLEI